MEIKINLWNRIVTVNPINEEKITLPFSYKGRYYGRRKKCSMCGKKHITPWSDCYIVLCDDVAVADREKMEVVIKEKLDDMTNKKEIVCETCCA